MLGIMTRPAVNRQDTLNLLYAETGLLNRPGFKTISRRYMMINYPLFIKPAWFLTISRQYIFGLRHWNHALINHWIILFKSSNSQHGWILLWLSVNQYYD